MKLFFREPRYGDLILEKATSSPFVGNNNTPIGGQTNAQAQITASHFCYSQSAFLDKYFLYTTNETITYYDRATDTWKTKSESAFEQITCENDLQASTTVDIS